MPHFIVTCTRKAVLRVQQHALLDIEAETRDEAVLIAEEMLLSDPDDLDEFMWEEVELLGEKAGEGKVLGLVPAEEFDWP